MRKLTEFSRGSHVPAATLNGMQEEQAGLIAATANPSGARALKGVDGRYIATPDAGVADQTLAVLDASVDWRNRALWGVLVRLESAAQRQHGADAWQANDPSRPIAVRRFEGRTGTGGLGAAAAPVANGTPPVIAAGAFAVVVDELGTSADRVYLYANATGALCVYNDSGAVLHGELLVWASAATAAAGAVPPIPTLTALEWLTPTTLALRPANPGAETRGVHRATDTGEIALWDGSAWRVMNGGGGGSASAPRPQYVPLLAGAVRVDLTSSMLVGGSPGSIDPVQYAASGYTVAYTLTLTGSVSLGGLTGEVQLVDDTGTVVATINVVASPASTPYTAAVTVPGAARTYELRARLTSTSGPGDFCTLIGAALRVSWS